MKNKLSMVKQVLINNVNVILIIVLVITNIIKILFVLSIDGPSLFFDELVYKEGAELIFYQHKYTNVQYPIGYSLVLSISFFWEDNYYLMMKLINVALWNVFILGVYKLVKYYTDHLYAIIASISFSVYPFSFFICSYINSENLYFPLIIWTVYFFIYALERKKNYLYIILGIFIFMLQVTRHITLVLLPIFFFVWILRYDKKKLLKISFDIERLKSALIVISTWIAFFAMWILYCLYQGNGLFNILGLNISSGIGSSNIEFATITSLLKSIALYGSCLIFELVLVIPILMIKDNNHTEKYIKLKWLSYGILTMLLIAAIRHTWRASYNYPEFIYILVRYFIYGTALIYIISLLTYYFNKETFKDKKRLLIANIFILLLFFLSALVIVGNVIQGVREPILDVFPSYHLYFYDQYNLYILPILSIILGSILLLLRGFIKYSKVIYCSFLAISIVGAFFSSYGSIIKNEGVPGYEFTKYILSDNFERPDFVINTSKYLFEYSYNFFTLTHNRKVSVIATNTIDEQVEEGDVILINNNDISEIKDFLNERNGVVFTQTKKYYSSLSLYDFMFNGNQYSVYKFPIMVDNSLTMVEGITPSNIYTSEEMEQSIVIKVNMPSGYYDVRINGQFSSRIFIETNGYGGIILDNSLIDKDSDYILIEIGDWNEYLFEYYYASFTIQLISDTSALNL